MNNDKAQPNQGNKNDPSKGHGDSRSQHGTATDKQARAPGTDQEAGTGKREAGAVLAVSGGGKGSVAHGVSAV